MRLSGIFTIALVSAAATQSPAAFASEADNTEMKEAMLSYPKTKTGNVSEEQFGEKIADPFRWLENDVREDADVAAWVKAQNQVTQKYLARLNQSVRL